MRGASADRRLDALLVLAVTQLHQRLVVQAQPRDLARFRRAYERGSGRPERTPLCETDEFVARLGPAPTLGHAAARPDFLRQQRAQEPEAQLTRRDALVALRELVHHGVDARALVDAACLAEGDVFAGDVLQLDRDVLEHVAQPRPLAFAHASEKAARLAIGAAVLGEAGQCDGEPVDVTGTEPAGGPGLQFAQVELETDDRKPRVVRGSDVNGTVEDAHGVYSGAPPARCSSRMRCPASGSAAAITIPAAREASRSRRLGMADPCLLRFDPEVNATRDLGRLQLPPAGERALPGRMARRYLGAVASRRQLLRSGGYSRGVRSARAEATRECRLKVAPATSRCTLSPSMQSG